MAIENQHKESKSLKDEITAKDSYKKNLEEYCEFLVMTSLCEDRPLMQSPSQTRHGCSRCCCCIPLKVQGPKEVS